MSVVRFWRKVSDHFDNVKYSRMKVVTVMVTIVIHLSSEVTCMHGPVFIFHNDKILNSVSAKLSQTNYVIVAIGYPG